MGAVDYFLKLDQVDGESADDKHKGEIDIQSFSWGESQTGHGHVGGGSGAGKVAIQDLHFTAQVSKGSGQMFQHCAAGTHLKDATVTARKAGGEQVDYFVIKLEDVFISSYQTGGSAHSDTVPIDQVSLNFSKVSITYKEQTAKGSGGGGVTKGWDVKANKKF